MFFGIYVFLFSLFVIKDRFTKESNQTDDLEKLRVFCQLLQSGNKANEVSDGFGKLLAWLESDNGIKSLNGGQFFESEEERKMLLVTLKLAIENNIRNGKLFFPVRYLRFINRR